MRIILAAITFFSFTYAFAGPTLMSDEFKRLLQENAYAKKHGTANPEQFFSSTKRIADKGDAAAQFLYGLALIKSNRDIAKEYLKKSANAGCVGSKALLGTIYMSEKNPIQGLPLIMSAAENGDASAQAALSGIYLRGDHGIEKSLLKAYAWLKLAERQTFSDGAYVAIEEGLKKIKDQLASDELPKADKEYEILIKRIDKYPYTFCGQLNIDTSRMPNIEDYLKI
jgi:TPR repeat protein